MQEEASISNADRPRRMIDVDGSAVDCLRSAVVPGMRCIRGSITVLDRKGLETAVCECYKVVNDEYNRLLGRGISRSFG